MFQCSIGSKSFVSCTDQRAYESCVAAIGRLAEFGHYELRRPLADILRDGIYELRIRKGRVNIRIPLFLSRKEFGDSGPRWLTKEDKVPKADIERAIRRKKSFEIDPAGHSYSEEGR